MRRRDFLIAAGSAAASPLVTRAQQRSVRLSDFCILARPKQIRLSSLRFARVLGKPAMPKAATSRSNSVGPTAITAALLN